LYHAQGSDIGRSDGIVAQVVVAILEDFHRTGKVCIRIQQGSDIRAHLDGKRLVRFDRGHFIHDGIITHVQHLALALEVHFGMQRNLIGSWFAGHGFNRTLVLFNEFKLALQVGDIASLVGYFQRQRELPIRYASGA